MAKLGLIIKQETERILSEKLQGADSLLLVNYSGISASDLNVLRNSLSSTGSSLMVIKNSVGKRIFKPNQDLYSLIEGPCGIIFVHKDLISISQVIYSFIKDKPNLKVKAGLLRDRVLTQKELEDLSKIPSLSALQAKLAGGLKSPIVGFVLGLKQILNKLVWVLEQIKDKKGPM